MLYCHSPFQEYIDNVKFAKIEMAIAIYIYILSNISTPTYLKLNYSLKNEFRMMQIYHRNSCSFKYRNRG